MAARWRPSIAARGRERPQDDAAPPRDGDLRERRGRRQGDPLGHVVVPARGRRPGRRGPGTPGGALAAADRARVDHPRDRRRQRAAGASEDALEDALLTTVGTVATAAEGAVRERFEEGKGHANAVEGLEPVLEAARTGAVDTLILVDGTEIPGELWVGSTPEAISTDPANLTEISDTEPVARPAEQVILRAVGALGGSVQVLGGGTTLVDNVGAILRFPTGS